MKKSLWAPIILLIAAIITLPACKAPAAFEVDSLNIVPPEVTAGDTANVTAEVKNIGGSEGTYTAMLTVNGAKVDTKEVSIAPGATEVVTFPVTQERAGTYQVTVGGRSLSLEVKEAAPVERTVELKYDNGQPYKWLVAVDGGYLVDFVPPVVPFTIQKIRIFGAQSSRGSEGITFDVEVWDKDRKVINKQTIKGTVFPLGKNDVLNRNQNMAEAGAWVDIPVPNIQVSDKFYIHVWKGPSMYGEIHLGADDSVKNEHSNITNHDMGDVREAQSWEKSRFCTCWTDSELSEDKSKVNWMIRTVGSGMFPEE